MNNTCKNVYAADIFSAAIVLFLFKTGGVLPHSENKLFRGMNLFQMMHNNNDLFWAKHCEVQNRPAEFFDQDFKDLFNSMVMFNPNDRASIEQIKKSNWYNGPTYNAQELCFVMSQLYNKA